jgi:hypothetical protein
VKAWNNNILSRAEFAKLKGLAEKQDESAISASPIMCLVILLTIGTTAIGFGLRSCRERCYILAGGAGLVLFLVFIQAQVGFPIERAIGKAMAARNAGSSEKAVEAAVAASAMFEARLTFWFWLAIVANLAVVGLAIAECRIVHRRRPYAEMLY